jgi:hypothetical protein
MSRIHARADTTTIPTLLESMLFVMPAKFSHCEIQDTDLAYPGRARFRLLEAGCTTVRRRRLLRPIMAYIACPAFVTKGIVRLQYHNF